MKQWAEVWPPQISPFLSEWSPDCSKGHALPSSVQLLTRPLMWTQSICLLRDLHNQNGGMKPRNHEVEISPCSHFCFFKVFVPKIMQFSIPQTSVFSLEIFVVLLTLFQTLLLSCDLWWSVALSSFENFNRWAAPKQAVIRIWWAPSIVSLLLLCAPVHRNSLCREKNRLFER